MTIHLSLELRRLNEAEWDGALGGAAVGAHSAAVERTRGQRALAWPVSMGLSVAALY